MLVHFAFDPGHIDLSAVLCLDFCRAEFDVGGQLVALEIGVRLRFPGLQLLLCRRNDDIGPGLLGLDLRQHFGHVGFFVLLLLLHEGVHRFWRDLLHKLRRVSKAGKLDNLGHCLAILLQIDHRIERPVGLDNLLLLLRDLLEERHPLLV